MAATQPPPPLQQQQPLLLRHVISFDKKISLKLHTLFHSYLPSSLLLILELSADFRFSFPITLSLSLSPLSPFLLPFLSSLLFGLLLDLALIGLLKITFRRSRPPYNPNMSAAVSADNYSFPSGHASRVFLVASLVSFSENAFLTALSELKSAGEFRFFGDGYDYESEKVVDVAVVAVAFWALITSMSRVFLGRHYFIDVFVGACFGILEGFIAFRLLRFEKLLSLIYQRVGWPRTR